MNCDVFRERVTEMLAEGADPSARKDLTPHRKTCPECSRYLQEMSRTFVMLQPAEMITASPGFKEKTMNRIAETPTLAARAAVSRRFQSRYWKLAVAAACLLGLFFLAPVNRLLKPETTAYALEQTIKANLGLRFLHANMEFMGDSNIHEMWFEFDDKGDVARARMSIPQSDDGPKEIVWQNDRAEIWFKAKNSDLITSAPDMLAGLKSQATVMDPRLIVEDLKKQQAKGRLAIETSEPADKGETITLTVTRTDKPDKLDTYDVDPHTKFVTRWTQYRVKNGKREFLAHLNYLDYNKPIDPSVFDLNPPADSMHIDETAGMLGLPKGDLSDNEIAVKVAREFCEALVAGQYDTAGRLAGGVPGSWLRGRFDRVGIKFIRVVSIGESRPHSTPETKGLQVPCKVEIERGGNKVVDDFTPGIRAIGPSQPDRWGVFGGI